MSALARELEEARKRAGDAEEAAYALRATLTATEKDAAYWQAECRAAEVKRGSALAVICAVEAAIPGCTGDLARDVAGLVATLREHEIALARVVAAASADEVEHGRAYEAARTLVNGAKADPAPLPERLQLCTPEAPKAALAVGDPVRVRLGDREAVGTVTRSPADGTLEAWRVAGAEGQELYARDGDIERVAVEGVK